MMSCLCLRRVRVGECLDRECVGACVVETVRIPRLHFRQCIQKAPTPLRAPTPTGSKVTGYSGMFRYVNPRWWQATIYTSGL